MATKALSSLQLDHSVNCDNIHVFPLCFTAHLPLLTSFSPFWQKSGSALSMMHNPHSTLEKESTIILQEEALIQLTHRFYQEKLEESQGKWYHILQNFLLGVFYLLTCIKERSRGLRRTTSLRSVLRFRDGHTSSSRPHNHNGHERWNIEARPMLHTTPTRGWRSQEICYGIIYLPHTSTVSKCINPFLHRAGFGQALLVLV